jgi:hypothetical protein
MLPSLDVAHEDARGVTIWQQGLSTERARSRLSGPGLDLLVIPSENLSPGRHKLEVLDLEQGDSLVEIPFEVRRDSALPF